MMSDEIKKTFYCYILKNSYEQDKNRTYNGFTTNPNRRIRQHNQDLVGGAKYTKRYGNKSWEIYALISGFPDKINALQAEWRIKHPTNKRKRPIKYSSPEGRIKGLNNVLKLDKWTNQSTVDNSDINLHLKIKKGYEHLIFDLPDNITVEVVDEISKN